MHAQALDQLAQNMPSHLMGPIGKEIRECGHNGGALGPVIGRFGVGSPDLGKLRDLAATELARKHIENYSMSMSQALSMITRQLNRD